MESHNTAVGCFTQCSVFQCSTPWSAERTRAPTHRPIAAENRVLAAVHMWAAGTLRSQLAHLDVIGGAGDVLAGYCILATPHHLVVQLALLNVGQESGITAGCSLIQLGTVFSHQGELFGPYVSPRSHGRSSDIVQDRAQTEGWWMLTTNDVFEHQPTRPSGWMGGPWMDHSPCGTLIADTRPV